MRTALREKILREIPEVEGRVYEIQVVRKDTAKPYVILKKGVDSSSEEWLGYKRVVDVIIYHKRTTFRELDKIAKKIIQALDKQLLVDESSKEAFVCLYDNSSSDYVDDEWDAITRTISFSVLALRPYVTEEFIESDDAVKAVCSLVKQNFPTITVYENTFPGGYNLPCVMFRLEGLEKERLTLIHFKIVKQLRGHVLGRTIGEQEEIAKNIVSLLKGITKFRFLDKFYTIDMIDYLQGRDKFREGQINLKIYSLEIVSQNFLPMQKVHVKGGM